MEIKAFGSGSAGNCYLISDFHTSILLEVGLPYSDILKNINYSISGIDAILISHKHKDHSQSIPDFAKFIKVYANSDVAKKYCTSKLNEFTNGVAFDIGTFKIIPFELYHDVPNSGFLIYSTITKEKLLYITDTMFINNKFKGVTHLMIECNYVDEKLMANKNYSMDLKKRIQRTHLGLNGTIEFIRANDWQDLKEVKLIHLSKENSDKLIMQEEIKKVLDKNIELECFIND